jgi:hypothetical protein
MYAPTPQLRDSGYARSISQLNAAPPTAPPHVYDDYRSPHDSPAQPPSGTLLEHQPRPPERYDESSVVGEPQIFSPEVILSPVSAESQYAPDYQTMSMPPMPPPDETSLRSYIRRASKIVHDISALPWVESGRVTVDYYPERSNRRDKLNHHPVFTWGKQSNDGVSTEKSSHAENDSSSPVDLV